MKDWSTVSLTASPFIYKADKEIQLLSDSYGKPTNIVDSPLYETFEQAATFVNLPNPSTVDFGRKAVLAAGPARRSTPIQHSNERMMPLSIQKNGKYLIQGDQLGNLRAIASYGDVNDVYQELATRLPGPEVLKSAPQRGHLCSQLVECDHKLVPYRAVFLCQATYRGPHDYGYPQRRIAETGGGPGA